MCEGEPRFDDGKFHNHCTKCPGFGMCIDDYREVHCDRWFLIVSLNHHRTTALSSGVGNTISGETVVSPAQNATLRLSWITWWITCRMLHTGPTHISCLDYLVPGSGPEKYDFICIYVIFSESPHLSSEAMSNRNEAGPKGPFDPAQELSFNQTPCGSQAKLDSLLLKKVWVFNDLVSEWSSWI